MQFPYVYGPSVMQVVLFAEKVEVIITMSSFFTDFWDESEIKEAYSTKRCHTPNFALVFYFRYSSLICLQSVIRNQLKRDSFDCSNVLCLSIPQEILKLIFSPKLKTFQRNNFV
jgi:hypothetical protein